jgi:UDP-N-acetylglucosamine--N-acetylmuramyl-(pentapeptide) pyrophosphoryl-undecaprenol N-acetylglucosamine transferase
VAELSSFRIPTLYIPLPQANYDEQTRNAEFYVKKHAALMLPQAEMTAESLRQKIMQLHKYAVSMREKLAQRPVDLFASKKLLELVKEVAGGGEKESGDRNGAGHG